MSLIKNTPGQFLYAVLNNLNDGTPITSGATLSLAKDGGAAAPAGATLTHKTEGLWEAALTQADCNANFIGYVWAGLNVIRQGGTIITVDYPRTAIANIPDDVLKRDWTAISGEASFSLLQAARMLRNSWATPGGVLQVKKEDGTTIAWSRVLNTDPTAQPIVGAT
jgi:hypothetical protein